MSECDESCWIGLAFAGTPILAALIWMIYLGADAYRNNR